MSLNISLRTVDKFLPRAKKQTRVWGKEQVIYNGFPVPTYMSTCPRCKKQNKWATLGLLNPIECRRCKKDFLPKQPTVDDFYDRNN